MPERQQTLNYVKCQLKMKALMIVLILGVTLRTIIPMEPTFGIQFEPLPCPELGHSTALYHARAVDLDGRVPVVSRMIRKGNLASKTIGTWQMAAGTRGGELR